MSNLSFRKPKCIISQDALSHSGKYWIYLGHHYHEAGKECWLIGIHNIITNQRIEYHTWAESINGDPKAWILIQWEKFLTAMLARPTYEEETDEWYKIIKPYLEREAKRLGVNETGPIVVES